MSPGLTRMLARISSSLTAGGPMCLISIRATLAVWAEAAREPEHTSRAPAKAGARARSEAKSEVRSPCGRTIRSAKSEAESNSNIGRRKPPGRRGRFRVWDSGHPGSFGLSDFELFRSSDFGFGTASARHVFVAHFGCAFKSRIGLQERQIHIAGRAVALLGNQQVHRHRIFFRRRRRLPRRRRCSACRAGPPRRHPVRSRPDSRRSDSRGLRFFSRSSSRFNWLRTMTGTFSSLASDLMPLEMSAISCCRFSARRAVEWSSCR